MPIQLPSPRSLALLGLLLISLAMLADGVARLELARAVNASINNGVRTVTHIVAADE